MNHKKKQGFFCRDLILAMVVLIGCVGCAEPELGRVEVTPEEKTLTIGDRITFKVIAHSTKGEEMPEVVVKWHIDGEAGSIDQSGVFTAEKPGKAAVIASADGITGKANVTVKPAQIAKLELKSEKETTFPETTVKLTVNGITSDEKPARYSEVAVSSPTEEAKLNTEKVMLNESGQAEIELTVPSRPGETITMASSNGVEGQVRIQVIPKPVAKIEIKPEMVVAAVESIVKFRVKGLAEDDLPAGYNDVTVSTPTAGTILGAEKLTLGANGEAELQVTAPSRPGETTVIIAVDGVKKEIEITVTPHPAEEIEVHPERTRALSESVVPVKVKGIAANGKPASYNEIIVSSQTEGTALSAEKLKLDGNGEAGFNVTLSPQSGENTIILKIGEVTEELRIEGTKIMRLEITPKNAEYEVGQKVGFKATGYDKYGNNRPVDATWSLSGQDATLQEDGNVIMQAPGSGILFSTYNDVNIGHPFAIIAGKVAKLNVEPQSAQLKAGDSATFKAQAFNAQDHPLTAPVEWSVEGGIGTIAEDGAFLARSTGEGKVIAASGEAMASVPVSVEHGPLADISIELEEETLRAGTKVKLSAMGVDAYANRFSITPQWFLSASLGTINHEQSLFFPLHTGTGEILAKVGNVLRGLKIEVVPAELARLDIRPQSVDIIAGETAQFEVTGYDRFGNNVEVEPKFSILDPLGDIDASGILKAEKSGSSVVRASVEEVVAESTVAVTAAEMERATMVPEAALELVAGKAQVLSVSGFDKFGNTVESEVAWDIYPDLGTIDQQGVLYPRKAGKGKIAAAITQLRTGKKLEIINEISIAPGETTKMELRPDSIRIVAGEEAVFSANAYDQFGNKTEVALNWRVEKSAAGSITQDGRFTAVRAGSCKVLVSYSNVIGSAHVEVIPAKVAFLKIIPEEISVQAGKKIPVKAITEDRFGNVVAGDILWNLSDNSLGVITSDNVLIAKRAGKGSLIATSHTLVEMAPIEVEEGPLHFIELKPDKALVSSGATIQFRATGFDAGGNSVAADFQWSVDENVGHIDSTGKLTAGKVGKGEVIVSFGGIENSAAVTVVPGTPASISLQPEQFAITAGETKLLSFEVYDHNGNLISSYTHRWEVEKDLGVVTEQNVFEAEKAGEGLIRLFVGEVTAQTAVKVVPGKIHSIIVMPPQAEMVAGQKQAFSATGFDSQGNELPLEPVWSVSGNIGIVDEKGSFQATRIGRGFVLIRMYNVTGLAEVTVEPGPIDHVAVAPEKARLRAGDKTKFSAIAYDAFGNVTPANFAWSLEGEQNLGEISPDAVFKAMKTGKAKIVATAGGVDGKAQLTIEPGSLLSIVLSPEQINLKSAEQLRIVTTGQDEFGNSVPIEAVMAVQPQHLGVFDKAGLFTALKAGFGKLTASVGEIETSVPVKIDTGTLKTLEIKLPEQDIQAGKTYQFGSIGYDMGKEVVPATVEWAVTQDVGRIERSTGLFYARKAGKGLVVAYSGKITAMKSIEVKPGELYSLFIEPNPVTVKADTIQTFEVSGIDVEKNQVSISVAVVDWETIGGIGVFEGPGAFHGTKMGKGKVIAKIGTLLAESYVNVIPGVPEFSNCRIRITYPNLAADGESFSEVLLEVRDKYHNPVPGVRVNLVSSRQVDAIIQPLETNNRGLARGRISSTQPGTSVIRAVVGGSAFVDTALIAFE